MIKIEEDDPVGELEPSFPYRDVKIRRGVDLKELYDVQSEIGRGKFGTVFKCKEKATGLFLAAKIVPTTRKEDKRNVEREIDIMRALQHPRLIQLYDAFDKDKTMVVVLELHVNPKFVLAVSPNSLGTINLLINLKNNSHHVFRIEGGELFERVIDDDFILTEKSCTAFMRQICEGMEFIHKQNILHLDMKPENILCLTKTGNRIKIIDFGLARRYDPDKKLQVLFGTPEFVAPEVVNFDQIGFGTDMWSIGVICYVLLSGLSPFMGETDIETMANVTVAKWDFDDEAFMEISEDAKDFISNLLVKEKEKRLSATQCLAHPWLHRKQPPVPVQKQPSVVKINPPPSELDLAKDNLKFFVERWNEHPNSPYIFDTSCQTISPCVSFNNIPDRRSRTPSLSGYSPSPCESISSLVDAEVLESPPQSPRKPFNLGHHLKSNEQSPSISPRNYFLDRLQIFDRRASDSSCLIKHNTDPVSRINLADEIKKLSDKLLKINNAQNLENHLNNNEETEFSFESDLDSNHVKFSSTTKVSNNFSKFEKQTNTTADFSGGKKAFFYSSTSTTKSTIGGNAENKSFLDLATPKRKFKFISRDVPLVSNSESECLSDTTSSTLSSAGHSKPSTPDLFPETPDLAKNILHILGKYDEISPKTDIRRTSLSMDWSEMDMLSQRTMKSVSNFIQSSRNAETKRKTTTKST